MTKLSKRIATLTLSAAAAVTLTCGVAGLRTVGVQAEETEIAPIAKYEFKDAANFGKDSMGNYDMSYANYWVAGGTGPLLDNGTLIEGGGVEFGVEKQDGAVSKGFCLAQSQANNIFNDVTAFTLAFEIKCDGVGEGTWSHLIGVGNGANNGFALTCSGADVRLGFKGTSLSVADWPGAILFNVGESFHKVIISVQPGGQAMAWVDGVLSTNENKLPVDIPEGWTALDQNSTFSIGATYNGNAVYASQGAIKNVAFYDFAMDATCAAAYNTNGKVTTADVSGMTTITGLSVTDESFGENAPTKAALFAGMSAEDMLAQMNEATATVTLSDETTATAPVVWTSVTESSGTYYANGTVNTSKLGYANVYGNAVSYELDVAEIEEISDPVFAGEVTKGELLDSMTEEEMLALINTATVTVTLPDGTKQDVTVTFSRIEGNMGVYAAYADVMLGDAVVGTVQVAIDVTATNEGDMQELLPVAKYEFEDASNPGKDSMGNYDLGPVAKEGGDVSNPYGTGTIENGVLYLSGNDMLACNSMNDVGDNLSNGFTLNFQYRQDGAQDDPQGWATPIAFGYNDWNPTVRCTFQTANGANDLRVGAHKGVADDGAGNTFWGPIVVQDGTTKMYNVTLSVRPGETFNIYVDGVLAYSHECPEGWSVTDSNMSFSIGGVCVWNNGYNRYKGWIDNVTIYNFALTLEQSNAYWEKGKLTVGDMDGEIITSISDQPKFENDEVTNGKLTDQLTDTQAVRRVNDATVDALFENGKAVSLPVTWQELSQEGDTWYIVGVVDTSNLGYASLLTGAQEVKQEVTVERVARTITILDTIKNGTVSADKTEAYLGDTVTFTATPAEGYKVDTVTVNGTALTANSDGTFSYTVEGIENLEVSATFKTAGSTTQPDTSDNDNNTGLIIGLSVGGAVIIIAAIVIAVIVVRKKKNGQAK